MIKRVKYFLVQLSETLGWLNFVDTNIIYSYLAKFNPRDLATIDGIALSNKNKEDGDVGLTLRFLGDELAHFSKNVKKNYPEEMTSRNKSMLIIIENTKRIADSDLNILVVGEPGTGKELIAETIHLNSSRKEKPFVVVNCAALPDELIERELFGYDVGALKNRKVGLIEIANGGTLVLDELEELGQEVQSKLLSLIKDGKFLRVGSNTTVSSNIRIIGIINKKLIEDLSRVNFNKDLFRRLSEVTLSIPPLRERKEDILLLINHFLQEKSPQGSTKRLSHEAEELLLNYSFPGNIRDLEYIIERALIFAEGDEIRVEDLGIYNMEKRNRESLVLTSKANLKKDILTKIRMIEEKNDVKELLNKFQEFESLINSSKWYYLQLAKQLGIKPDELGAKIYTYQSKN